MVCGKSSISAGLKFDAGDGLKGLPSRVEFDVLGSKAVHPVDTRISHSISSKLGGATTTRLIVERTDGSEHVIYAPYWIPCFVPVLRAGYRVYTARKMRVSTV